MVQIGFSKRPSFKEQPPTTPVQLLVGRIILFPSSMNVFLSGSCVRIARNLYLTAKHVVEDYLIRFGAGQSEVSCEGWIVHVESGPNYSVWSIQQAWLSPHSDLALIRTQPFNDVAAENRLCPCVGLELSPPTDGERVAGFGFHSGTGTVRIGEGGSRHIEINVIGSATVGEVGVWKLSHTFQRAT
jgi:hypothetical protein